MAKLANAPQITVAEPSADASALRLTFVGVGKAGADIFLFDDSNDDGKWQLKSEPLLAKGQIGADGNWTLTTGFLPEGRYHFRTVQGNTDRPASQESRLDYLPVAKFLTVTPSVLKLVEGIDGSNQVTYTVKGAANASVQVTLNPLGDIDAARIAGLPSTPITLNADGLGTVTLTIPDDGIPEKQQTLRLDFSSDDGVNVVAQAVTVNEAVRLSADRTEIFEGNAGADTVTYTVQGTPGMTVDLSLADGTAQAGDVSGFPGSLALGADGTASFALTALDDSLAEGDENLIVTAISAQDANDRTVAPAVVVHDRLPVPALVSIDDDTGASPTDRVTQDNVLFLRGTADGNVAQVQVLLDGAELALAPVAGGSWSVATPALSDGVHTFTFRSVAANGFLGQDASSADVTIDTAPPVPARVNALNADSPTPTISGTWSGQPGESLQIAVAGKIYSPVTDGTNWSLTLPSGSALPGGVFDVVATTLDASGNASQDATSNELTVRAVVPPVIQTLTDDTGAAADDRITRDNTPTLSGTADPGAARVNIYQSAERELRVGTADVSGNSWSFTSGALDDGAYVFLAKSVDANGNESDSSSPFSVTIDTRAPVAATVNALNTDDPTPILSGTWSGEAGDTLSVLVAGKTYTPSLSGTTWTLRLAAGDALPDGTYDVVATTVDTAGNASRDATSNELKIAAANAPTILSFEDDTGADASDRITRDNSPTLSGRASGGVESVNVYANGLKLGSADVSGGAWRFASDTLGDGTYSFVARSVGAGGKESGPSVPLTIKIDATPPVEAKVDPLTTQNPTPKIGGTWSGASGDRLTVSVAGNTYVPDTVGTVWSLTPTDKLAPGVYDVVALTEDAAGNLSQDLSVNELTVKAPAIPTIVSMNVDTGADAADRITRDDTPTFSGIASDKSVKINLYRDGAPVGTVDAGGGVWSFDSAPLADGKYAFTATGVDENGKESDFSAPFAVTIDAKSPDPATVDPLVTTDAMPTLTGVWSGGAGETLRVSVNGKTYVPAVAGTSWSVTVPDADKLRAGVYDIVARTEDLAGNFSLDATSNELTVKPLNAPIIEFLSEDTGRDPLDGVTADNTPTLSGSAGENVVSVSIYRDGQSVGTATPLNGVWTFDGAPLDDGKYSFTATGMDSNGKESDFSAPFVATIDVKAPEPAKIDVLVTSDPTPTLTGTWSGGIGEKLSVDLNGKLYEPELDGQNWRLTVPDADKLAGKVYDVVARTEDLAGNFSLDETVGELTVNALTPPLIVSVADDTGADATDRLTKDNTPVLSGTADDKTAQVNILQDGVPVGMVAAQGGAWVFESLLLPDGTYIFTAEGLDANGLKSDVSDPFEITVDTKTPAIPVVNSQTTTDTTPDISGTWPAGPDEIFSVSLNGKLYAPSFSGDNWSLTVPDGDALTPGIYDVVAKAVDLAGNESRDTTTGELVVNAIVIAPPPPPPPSDPFLGTSGNDTISATLAELTDLPAVNGLGGTDTLAVAGDNITVNDAMFANFAPNSMEILNFLGTGLQTAILGPNWDAAFNSKVMAPNASSLTVDAGSTAEGIAVVGTPNTDTITGGSGNDTLDDGGGGADLLIGNQGDDVYYIHGANAEVVEQPSYGNDTVFTTVGYTLSFEIENGVAFKSGIALTGNLKGNLLKVDSSVTGGVTLDGGSGPARDTLIGGAGDDILHVATRTRGSNDDDGDIIDGGPGINTLVVNGDYTPMGNKAIPSVANEDDMLRNVKKVELASLGTLNLYGQSEGFDIAVTNNLDGNVVSGGLGIDIIRGGAGDDTIDRAGNQDVIWGGLETEGDSLLLFDNYTPSLINALQGQNLSDIGLLSSDDDVLQEIEYIALANLSSPIAVDLSSQSEDFLVDIYYLFDGSKVRGGKGNDSIFGNAGNDIIDGGIGNDIIDGGIGADTMTGGAGDDFYFVDNANDDVRESTVDGGSGIDTVAAAIDYTLQTDVENGIAFKSGIALTGNSASNFLKVHSTVTGAVTLNGGAGDDIIVGGPDADTLSGGDGDDSFGDANLSNPVNGADNDDVIDGDSGTNPGTKDRLYLTQSYAPSGDAFLSNVELVDIETASGGQTIDLSNQTEAFTIWLKDANGNTVKSGAGDDIFIDVHNNDSIDGGGGTTNKLWLSQSYDPADGNLSNVQQIEIKTASGGATISLAQQSSTEPFTIKILDSFGDTVIGGTADDTIYGGGGGDSIVGAGGIDTVYAGDGADTIVDDAGDDVYHGDNGNDTFFGAGDTDIVDGGNDYDTLNLNGSYSPSSDTNLVGIEKIVIVQGTAGSATVNLGNQSDSFEIVLNNDGDSVTAGGGNDTITGGGGNDTIAGGVGADDMTGGGGDDTFVVGNADSGVTTATADIIRDFQTGQDKIKLFFSVVFQDYGYSLTSGDDLTVEQAVVIAENNAFRGLPPTIPDNTLVYIYDDDGGTAAYLVADVNGDLLADFVIKLAGLNTVSGLVSGDII